MEPLDLEGGESVPFPCARCDYDIGMTDFHSVCPECGCDVWITYWGVASDVDHYEFDFDWVSEDVRERLSIICQASGHPTFSVWFVEMAIEDLRRQEAGDAVEYQVSAEELCESLYRQLWGLGPDTGYRAAVSLNLDDPVRISDLVFAMVENGALVAQPGDGPEDFQKMLPALFWFENRRRWQKIQSWKGWPCGGWWAKRKIQRWRNQDKKLQSDIVLKMEADWQGLISSKAVDE